MRAVGDDDRRRRCHECELPKGGVTLDAVAMHGRLRLPDRTLDVKEGDDEQRSDAKIRGGGPTLRLRNEHADIVVRDGAMMEHDTGTAEHPRPPSRAARARAAGAAQAACSAARETPIASRGFVDRRGVALFSKPQLLRPVAGTFDRSPGLR